MAAPSQNASVPEPLDQANELAALGAEASGCTRCRLAEGRTQVVFGVGNPHAEPHIPCYTVEQLAPLMVRAVRSELSGKRVEAEEQYTIRTVGKGQGGMCEKPKSVAKLAK